MAMIRIPRGKLSNERVLRMSEEQQRSTVKGNREVFVSTVPKTSKDTRIEEE